MILSNDFIFLLFWFECEKKTLSSNISKSIGLRVFLRIFVSPFERNPTCWWHRDHIPKVQLHFLQFFFFYLHLMMMMIPERLPNPLKFSKHGRPGAGIVCIELLSLLSYDIRPLKSVDRPRADPDWLWVGTSFTTQITFWFYTKNKHDRAIRLRALKDHIQRTNTMKSECLTTIFNGLGHGLKTLLGTKFFVSETG